MTERPRTTFNVKVSNKLPDLSIWCKIAAELTYNTQTHSSLSYQQSAAKSNTAQRHSSNSDAGYSSFQSAHDTSNSHYNHTSNANRNSNSNTFSDTNDNSYSASNKNYNSESNRKRRSGSNYRERENHSSNYNNNKTHNINAYGSSRAQNSSYDHSRANAQSSDTHVGVKGNYGLASVDVNVDHKQSSANSSRLRGAQASSASNNGLNDNLQHNISSNSNHNKRIHSQSHDNLDAHSRIASNANSLATHNLSSHYEASAMSSMNASSNAHGGSSHNYQSRGGAEATSMAMSRGLMDQLAERYHRQQQQSQSAVLLNKTIEPGFVCIGPSHTLSIPVTVENESQISYIYIYYYDPFSTKKIILANGLQINRQLIEIRENPKTQQIDICPESDLTGNYNKFRDLLLDWGFPESVCDAMKNAGFDKISLWDNISDEELQRIGFKGGHLQKFRFKYSEWRKCMNRSVKKLTYKDLLTKWKIPHHLQENMGRNGWDDVELWSAIDDNDLKEMKFEKGNITKFRKHVNAKNDWIKEFKKMQKDFNNHSGSLNMKDDYNYDQDEDMMNDYQKNEIPLFWVDKIYQNAFVLEFMQIPKAEVTVLMRRSDYEGNWKIVGRISKTKTHTIKGLEKNKKYSVKICYWGKYSDPVTFDTKNRIYYNGQNKRRNRINGISRKNKNKMGSFKCHVWDHRNKSYIKDPNEFEVYFLDVGDICYMDTSKYNYYIEIALNDNNNNHFKWMNMCKLEKNKYCYLLKLQEKYRHNRYLSIRICRKNKSLSVPPQYSEIYKFNNPNGSMYKYNRGKKRMRQKNWEKNEKEFKSVNKKRKIDGYY